MRAVIQRVSEARVETDGRIVGRIGPGLLVLLGISREDTVADARYLAGKIPQLRIFSDADDKMNRSLLDVGGALLAVSQFTLYGNTRKGRRPSFVEAALPDHAQPLYEEFIRGVEQQGVAVEKGIFGAMMNVWLCNEGPVTILMESRDRLLPRRETGAPVSQE